MRHLELLGCRVDLEGRFARWPDGDRALTPTETALLRYLAEQEGRAVARQELLKEVWGYRGGVITRTVKTTVGRLRTKIERDPHAPEHLHTAVGVGYRLELAPPEVVERAREESVADLARPQDTAPTETRSNLPSDVPELVGRDGLLGALEAEPGAVITAVGPAGVGKTAALRRWAGAEVGALRWDEVGWCDLGACRTAADVRGAVAASLGMERPAGSDDEGWLAAGLAGRGRLFLVLDTAEGCAAPLAALLEGWRERCPGLAVAIGSREALRLSGERVVPVPPLDASAAASLFARRLPVDALPAYAEEGSWEPILARLEGLPLALEMAAGWASLLPPEQLAARLVRQLDLLAGDRRDRPDRHASLRAAIRSSWELIDPDERDALRQLAVFAGPFRPADAEAVLRTPRPTLLLLRALVARSLVATRTLSAGEGEVRIALFAAVRDFAREQGVPEDAEQRHGAWFARWGEPSLAEALRCRGGADIVALDGDRDDLVAAGERAAGRGDRPTAIAVARALGVLVRFRGAERADIELLDELIEGAAAPDAAELRGLRAEVRLAEGGLRDAERDCDAALAGPPVVAAEAARLRALLRLRSNPPAAAAAAAEAVDRAGAVGDPALTARADAVRAWIAHRVGAGEAAAAALEDAAERLREEGDDRGRAEALAWAAEVHRDRGRPLRAASLLAAAIEGMRRVGDRRAEGALLLSSAEARAGQGDADVARAAFLRAASLLGQLGDALGAARARLGLGRLSVAAGQAEDARAPLDKALHAAQEGRDRALVAQVLEARGAMELALGHHAAAGAALRDAVALAREAGLPRDEGLALGSLGALRAEEGELPEARRCFAAAEALLRPAAWRMDRVTLLEGWAQAEADAGQEGAASGLLEQAEQAAQLSLLDGPALL